MGQIIKPVMYEPLLDMKQTEQGIKLIKEFFQQNLSTELRLRRVTAPLFVLKGLGINDDLNGVERPVSFPIKDLGDAKAEVVHSLAKWKRLSLAEYKIEPGYGIYTDMNAIRADEELDNLHSLYVDQWDWEAVIRKEDRTLAFLKNIVERIYAAKANLFNTLPKPKPMVGAFEALTAAKELDCKIVLVTGSAQVKLLESLEQHYPGFFSEELMVTGFDVKRGKPDPEPYLMGLEKAGVKAEEAIVVENAPLGVESAKGAGIFTIAANTGPLEDEILKKAGADIVVSGLKEVADLLRELRTT